MPRTPEQTIPSPLAGEGQDGGRPATAAAIVLRAALYALAILALVIFAPVGEHTFVYLGF